MLVEKIFGFIRFLGASLCDDPFAHVFEEADAVEESAVLADNNVEVVGDVTSGVIAVAVRQFSAPSGSSMGVRGTSKERASMVLDYKARYLDNVNIVYNAGKYGEEEAARAYREIFMVHASLPKGSLVRFVSELVQMSESAGALVAASLNLVSAAKASKTHLMIRRRQKDERIRHSRGKYRLFVFNPSDTETPPAYFNIKGKVETAIYYTLLVHKKQTGDEMIDICELRELFIGVYRALYVAEYDDAYIEFLNIMDSEDEVHHYQGRYRNLIPNIRASVDAMMVGKGDDPAIYYYEFHYDSKGKNVGRFWVDADHITIEQGFLDEIKCLQNPKSIATTA